MKNIIYVDGSLLVYRVAHTFRDFKTSADISSGVPFGIVRAIKHLKLTYNPARIYFVWDSFLEGAQTVEGYKANRVDSPLKQEVYTWIPKISGVLSACGVDQLKSDGFEADKIVGHMVLSSADMMPGYLFLLYTKDNDYLQLVRDNKVHVVYPPGRGQKLDVVYNSKMVEEKYGVPPELLTVFRAFDGDSSDNLPRVPRLSKEKIVQAVLEYKSVQAILSNLDSIDYFSDTAKEKIREMESQIWSNYEISLMTVVTPSIKLDYVPGNWDELYLREYLKEYEINSILKDDLTDSLRIWDNIKVS